MHRKDIAEHGTYLSLHLRRISHNPQSCVPTGDSSRLAFRKKNYEQRNQILAIRLSKLEKYFSVEKLIYHSVDLSLYQASAIIDGQEHYITDDKNKFLRSVNLVELQKQLRNISTEQAVLRHTSAYDEMIGAAEKTSHNTLEVPLKDNQLY